MLFDYNLKLVVTWMSPSMKNWTINTASCKCIYRLGLFII